MSETPQLIEARFVAAWSSVKNPELDGKNKHFGNKYATLKSTLNVIREACTPYGIAYCQQLCKVDTGEFELHSFIIADDATEMTLSVFPVETPPNPQSFGSNMTYAKRQQAQADWCITGEEDDDGEAGAEAANYANYSHQASQGAGNQNKAYNSRQNAPQTKNNQEKSPEEKKAAYIAKIQLLKDQAVEAGIKPEGIDGYVEAKYPGKKLEEMTLPELTAIGKYLAQLIHDKEEVSG